MIELKPETAMKLQSLAADRGISVDEVLRIYVPGLSMKSTSDKAIDQIDKVAEFDAWINEFSTSGPNLPDEAISRESIYPDR